MYDYSCKVAVIVTPIMKFLMRMNGEVNPHRF